jgi:hypothetical protein
MWPRSDEGGNVLQGVHFLHHEGTGQIRVILHARVDICHLRRVARGGGSSRTSQAGAFGLQQLGLRLGMMISRVNAAILNLGGYGLVSQTSATALASTTRATAATNIQSRIFTYQRRVFWLLRFCARSPF